MLASTVAPARAAWELGGTGHPHVLADLDEQREIGHVAGPEDEVGTERDLRAGDAIDSPRWSAPDANQRAS